MTSKLNKNTHNAFSFYHMAYKVGEPGKAIKQFVENKYIRHKPLVGKGKDEPLIDYFERMAQEHADKDIVIIRSVAEGDQVLLCSHQHGPEGIMNLAIDHFRFDENNKIVEHWDTIQRF